MNHSVANSATLVVCCRKVCNTKLIEDTCNASSSRFNIFHDLHRIKRNQMLCRQNSYKDVSINVMKSMLTFPANVRSMGQQSGFIHNVCILGLHWWAICLNQTGRAKAQLIHTQHTLIRRLCTCLPYITDHQKSCVALMPLWPWPKVIQKKKKKKL